MRHVSQIRKIVEKGQLDEAQSAIADLLELGPHNLEALKLKAALYEHVGRFDEEELVWRRVLEVDSEDEDALYYFQKAQLEDREHYYFTDPMPDGGRRFLAYPRMLVSVSFIGLVGCVSFLFLTRLNGSTLTRSPVLLLTAFAIMVVSPWLAIVYLYLRAIRSINISQAALEITTRFKTFRFLWTEIERISLAHSGEPEHGELRLLITPRDKNLAVMCIDFGENTSSVRARRHLVHEIRDNFKDITYDSIDSSQLKRLKLKRF